jgi:hypothetical protein
LSNTGPVVPQIGTDGSLGSVGSKMINGLSRTPAAQTLLDEGMSLTPGQMNRASQQNGAGARGHARRRRSGAERPLQRALQGGLLRLQGAIPQTAQNLGGLYGRTGVVGLIDPRLQQLPGGP